MKTVEDADYVVTDSFHGCVFSIIFGKEFVAYANRDRGMARFTSLLRTFGLEVRLVTSFDENKSMNIISSISDAQKKMEARRYEALNWLEDKLTR